MRTDRDLELGAALRSLPTPEHGPAFWADLDGCLDGVEPMQPEIRAIRRFRPRGMLLLSAAAVVAVVIAATSFFDGGAGTKVRVGPPATTPETEQWTTLGRSPLSARSGAAAVWTGTTMFVWGGDQNDGQPLRDGAVYDPATDRWKPVSSAPTGPLAGPTAVWTGRRVLLWGARQAEGEAEASPVGALYDPVADSWTAISPTPLRSVDQSLVWTGEVLLAWGGSVGESPAGDGAAYDPDTDTWTPMARAPIAARFDHTAVWTGDRMIVWGGFSGEESPSRDAFGDGAAYDPAADAWTSLPAAPIAARAMHVAVWTGTSMVVWGGAANASGLVRDGAVYDPGTRTWTAMPPAPLTPRTFASGVADRGTLLVWGGENENGATDDGAAYDVATGAWRSLPGGPLAPRSRHSAVWTGSAMLVWGGADRTDLWSDGAALRPPTASAPGAVPPTAAPVRVPASAP